MSEVPIRVTRKVLRFGLVIERHQRGQPREQAVITNLHRKDHIAEIRVAAERRQVPFADLTRHWYIIKEEA